jgi:hypothetical protein
MEQERIQADYLPWLVPQLAGEALERGLKAALVLKSESYRAEVLAALGPHMTGEVLERVLDVGLHAAQSIKYENYRAKSLLNFLPVVPDPTFVLRSARQAITEHLQRNLAASKREELLQFCAEEKLFAPPLLDQDTLAAIAGHIIEVCQEWRWM